MPPIVIADGGHSLAVGDTGIGRIRDATMEDL